MGRGSPLLFLWLLCWVIGRAAATKAKDISAIEQVQAGGDPRGGGQVSVESDFAARRLPSRETCKVRKAMREYIGKNVHSFLRHPKVERRPLADTLSRKWIQDKHHIGTDGLNSHDCSNLYSTYIPQDCGALQKFACRSSTGSVVCACTDLGLYMQSHGEFEARIHWLTHSRISRSQCQMFIDEAAVIPQWQALLDSMDLSVPRQDESAHVRIQRQRGGLEDWRDFKVQRCSNKFNLCKGVHEFPGCKCDNGPCAFWACAKPDDRATFACACVKQADTMVSTAERLTSLITDFVPQASLCFRVAEDVRTLTLESRAKLDSKLSARDLHEQQMGRKIASNATVAHFLIKTNGHVQASMKP